MQGRAIAQAVSRWLPTAAARVQTRVWSSGICGGQSGSGVSFLRVLPFPLSIFIPPIGHSVADVPSGPSLDSTSHYTNRDHVSSMIRWSVNVEQLVEWELAGEIEVLKETPCQCNFVHYNSHVIWPEIELGQSWWGSLLLQPTWLQDVTTQKTTMWCYISVICI
jgi:hypothetical protein